MDIVVLTIVFFASAANVEMTTRVDLESLRTCNRLAEHWLAYRDGSVRVVSARCEPARSAAASAPLAKAE